jgi:hypothetical protein
MSVPPTSAPIEPVPTLEFLAVFSIDLGEPVEVGPTPDGVRRIIPITGGLISGPELRGHVLPGGADFQLLRSESLTELDARYSIATDDGENIYVENRGLRSGEPADIARMVDGEPVDPARVYFRTAPKLTPTGSKWAWLGSRLFLAVGERHPDRVKLNVFVVR